MVLWSEFARSATLLAVIALLVALVPPAFAEEEEPGPTVSMQWALAARDAVEERPVAVTSDTTLATGARLKLFIEPLSAGYYYVILLDSSDELNVLYRESSEGQTGRTYIPAGKQWFELGESPGRETFFLLASTDPLAELDGLLDAFAAAESASREELQSKIIAEIRNQHRQHRRFSRPVEKPVLIGGRTRGGAGIDHLAAEVNAERFFGKTITIDR